MNEESTRKDLLILVADKDTELALRELLNRPQALGINTITYNFYKHPNRDSGCFSTAHEFLRAFANQYKYALVVFDKDGSGQENQSITEIETNLKNRLSINGWKNKAEVIVIDPELEIWVWSDSPNVDTALGWTERNPSLRSWLLSENLISSINSKPSDPKIAFENAIKKAGKPRSASIFADLAKNVGFDRCTDISFSKLKATLQQWFGTIE